MVDRRGLALQALRMAIRTRRDLGLGLSDGVCAYDVATEMGVEVLVQELRGVEGLYLSKPRPMILVSALRPPGRQAYTCAHELGHHVAGHGSSIDDEGVIGGTDGSLRHEEFLVEAFSGFLLMPSRAVRQAFSIRGEDPMSCSPVVYYAIASSLGVGYATLAHHAHRALGLIDSARHRSLAKTTPKQIKKHLLGRPFGAEVVIVDDHWSERPIDLRVGDLVLASTAHVHDGSAVVGEGVSAHGVLLRGRVPGVAKVIVNGRSMLVRVSRRDYVGRAVNRYLEDPGFE